MSVSGKLNTGAKVSGEATTAKAVTGSVKRGIVLSASIGTGKALAGTVDTGDTLKGAVNHGSGGSGGGNLSEIRVRSQKFDYIEKPASGFYGIGEVLVMGDLNLEPENIKDGVTLFGVTGNYKAPPPAEVKLTGKTVTIKENGTHTIYPPSGYVGMTKMTAVVDVPTVEEKVDAVLQSKSVTPGKSTKTIEPDDGFDALSSVVVAGDGDLLPENIRQGVNIFGVDGTYEKTEIVDAVFQSKSVTPGKGGFTVKPDEGFDGLSSVSVAGDGDLIPANIREGVNIFGVEGSYSTGQIFQNKTVTPNASGLSVTADKGFHALAKVEVKGDSALAPGNIASGVTIFGVKGSYVSPMKPVEVFPALDEQYILPAGYVGFSSVTVHPYDPAPHYNEGYDAGHEAGHAVGFDDGYRAACEAHGIEPLYYLYNGVRLPAPPEWDKETYPYAAVTYCGSQALPYGFYFVVSNAPLIMSINETYSFMFQIGKCISTKLVCRIGGDISPDDYAWVNYSSGEEGVWDTPWDSEDRGFYYFSDPIWANYDVEQCDGNLKPLGTTALYASEPKPIYK